MPAGAVTGLVAEARIAERAGLRAAVAGGDAADAMAAIDRLVATGVCGLVSFGIAGGLSPSLVTGTLLLPRAVWSESGERYPVDEAWRTAVATALGHASPAAGDMLGADAIVGEVASKTEIFRRLGTVAVDLESHLVARVAARAAIPFIVLRAVADPAGRSLPPAALVGLDARGRPALGRVLGSLARDPGQLPALLGVARDTRRALAALRRIESVPTAFCSTR